MAFTIATFNTRDFFDDEPPGVIGELDMGGYTAKRHEKATRLFASKIETIAAWLVRIDADIVCLQEVKNQNVVERLHQALGARIRPYPVRVVGEGLDPRGIRIALLSRFELAGSVQHHGVAVEDACPLPGVVEGSAAIDGIRLRRGVLEVPLEIPGVGRLIVISMHLKSNNPLMFELPRTQHDHSEGIARSAMHRIAEALFVRRLADAHFAADPSCALAIAGDFNETEDSLVHRIICGSEVAQDRYSLMPGVLKSCLHSIPQAERFSIMFRGRPMLLDHIVASPALHARCTRSLILNQELAKAARTLSTGYTFSPESDHAPVMAWFE